jgi:hypothetical protein
LGLGGLEIRSRILLLLRLLLLRLLLLRLLLLRLMLPRRRQRRAGDGL